MPDDKRLTDLTSGFAAPSRAEWEALACKAAGVESVSELASTTDDGIKIEALYAPADVPSPVPVPGIAAAPVMRPLVAEPTPEAANAAIRDEIEGGASEVLLQIESPGMAGVRLGSQQDFDRTLGDVDPGDVAFHLRHATPPDEAPNWLIDWWERHDGAGARGGLGLDPIGAAADGGLSLDRLAEDGLAQVPEMIRKCGESAQNATALTASGLPYHEAGATEAQELAATLATALSCLRACAEAGVAPVEAASWIAVELAADCDLILTIAKLRAARLLWALLGEECGFDVRANLAVQTSARMMCARDPETNTLRSSMAALGAGIGGADAITVLPHTHALGRPDAAARRLARNTWHVLGEEARIGAVADAVAGAWEIESLTQELCETAWTLFAEIESQGGMIAALASGWLQSRIGAARDARARDVEEGARVLVGATAYQPEHPAPVTAEPWAAPPPVAGEILRPVALEDGVPQ